MNPLETYIFETFARAIRSWNTPDVEDIYALAFLILNEEDDLRRLTVRLLYNTETEWRRQRGQASSAGEARWRTRRCP